MEKKLALKNSDHYDLLVATFYAAQEIVSFLGGKPCCASLGIEQGDIKEWDDIVLEYKDSPTIHCQVKRQMEDFSTLKVEWGCKTRGPHAGKAKQELSTLDKALQELGEYVSSPNFIGGKKKFRLAIPHLGIQIKKGLKVSHLHSVSTSSKKSGATLESLESGGGHFVNVKTWLKSWCGFKSDESIFECLKVLEICILSDEDFIRNECEKTLLPWFEQPQTITIMIAEFLVSNASSNHSFTPRMILEGISKYIRKNVAAWTDYKMKDQDNWQISSTVFGSDSAIASPKNVVECMWNYTNRQHYRLQMSHRCFNLNSSQLNRSIARLAIHKAPLVDVAAVGSEGWTANVAQIVRNTLGASLQDSDIFLWTWRELDEQHFHLEYRALENFTSVEQESHELETSMDALTWKEVSSKVSRNIGAMKRGEIRMEIENTWKLWRSEVDDDFGLQGSLIADMLYARSEGDVSLGKLRAGPKTTELVSEALLMLLQIAVGLNDDIVCWRDFNADKSLRTVALLYWAGPNQEPGPIRKFFERDNAAERSKFLGTENVNMLILPQPHVSASVIYGSTLAAGRDDGDSIADVRTPATVFTITDSFKKAVEGCSLEDFRAHIRSATNQRQKHRQSHIDAFSQGLGEKNGIN